MNIAMLLSGGVDSSVSLRLLQDAGHTVHAFYLKIWLEDEMAFLGECPWEDDLKYVRAVCEQAGVPLSIVPFQKEYWERVVSYTIAEAKAGRTPNPDVLCNAQIKFGAFYDYIYSQKEFSFDRIATGHYAQVYPVASRVSGIGTGAELAPTPQPRGLDTCLPAGRAHPQAGGQEITLLKMSPDPIKDQTYFLSQLTQQQVSKACFPIGHLHKEEVRALAEKYDLPNAKRKDSQGICFLGKIAFDKFLEFHLGKKEGDIIDLKTGEKIGAHDGFWF